MKGVNIFLVGFGFSALLIVYLFQGVNYASWLGLAEGHSPIFINNVNKTVRFVINDVLAIMIIAGLFQHRRYVWLALTVQAVGTLLILVPYLFLKIAYPSYNGPLISFLHRLVVNPLLLLTMIPAIWYQQRRQPQVK